MMLNDFLFASQQSVYGNIGPDRLDKISFLLHKLQGVIIRRVIYVYSNFRLAFKTFS